MLSIRPKLAYLLKTVHRRKSAVPSSEIVPITKSSQQASNPRPLRRDDVESPKREIPGEGKAPRLQSKFERWLRPLLFALVVVVPTVLMFSYAVFTGSGLYETQVDFAVRSGGSSGGEELGGIAAAFGIGGGSSNDIYAIRSKLQSADSLIWLDDKLNIVEHYSDTDKDWLLRLKQSATIDEKLNYVRNRIRIDLNITEQIVTLKVQAFDPAYAVDVANALVKYAERFVNQLNERAERDLVSFAERELASAHLLINARRIAITKWRNENSHIDPAKSAEAQLTIINTLEAELAAVRAELIEFDVASDSPGVRAKKRRERSLIAQIEKERERVVGRSSEMANLLSEFERLSIDRELADQNYATAMEALKFAKQEAIRQQKYIVVTASPAVLEEYYFPRPIYHTFLTLLSGMVIFIIISFFATLLRDYRSLRH